MAQKQTPEPVQFDSLLADLRKLFEAIAAQHKYWEVRVHGSDGRARIEVIYQGGSYSYRHPPAIMQAGSVIHIKPEPK